MVAFSRRNKNLEQTLESTPESSEGSSKDEEKWFAEFEGKNPYAKPEIRAKLAASDSADAEYRIRMKTPEPKKMKEPNRLAKFLRIGVLRNWKKEAAWLEQQDEMNKERAERIAAEHTVEQSLDNARAETRETKTTVAEARNRAAEGSPAATRLDALAGAAEENATDLESTGKSTRARIEGLRPVDPKTVSVDRLNQLLEEREAADDDTLTHGEGGHMSFETTKLEELADEREDDDQMEDTGGVNAEPNDSAETRAEAETDAEPIPNAKELLDQIDTGGDLVDVVHQLASLSALDTSKTTGRHNVEHLISELKGELEGEGYEFDEIGAIKLEDDKALYKNSGDEGRVKLLQGLYELQELESSLHKQNDAVGYGEGGKFPFEPPKPGEEDPKKITLRNIKAEFLAMFNDKDNDGVYSEVLADDILKEDFISRDPELGLQAMSDLIRGLKEGLLQRGIRVSDQGTIILDDGSPREQNPKHARYKKNIDWLNAFILAKEKLERRIQNQKDEAIAYGEDGEMPFEPPKLSLDERIKRLSLHLEAIKKTENPHEGHTHRIGKLEARLSELTKIKQRQKRTTQDASLPESKTAGPEKSQRTKKDDIRALGEEIQKLYIKKVAKRQKQGLGLVGQSEPKRKVGTDRNDLKKAA